MLKQANYDITSHGAVLGLRVAHNRLATGRLLVATPISLMSTQGTLLCGYTVRRIGSASVDNAANLKSMLSQKDKKELRKRASIIREGAELEARVESFISKYSHPNHRSNDSALDELADDIIKLLSERKGLTGYMEGFEGALSKLTTTVKGAEIRGMGQFLMETHNNAFLIQYVVALGLPNKLQCYITPGRICFLSVC